MGSKLRPATQPLRAHGDKKEDGWGRFNAKVLYTTEKLCTHSQNISVLSQKVLRSP